MAARIDFEDLRIGIGELVERKSRVRVRYDLFLHRGEQIQRDVELTIDLATREVIAGLRYGLEGMRVGGRRRIVVPPHLGYGERGVTCVPPNALLVFEVELLDVHA